MSAFTASRDALGTHALAVLADHQRGREVRIACRGATVLSIQATHTGAPVELADGYRDAVELEARPSSRFAVMLPFANRINDARYTFDGRRHDLHPAASGPERAARHGFVRGADFTLAALNADAEHATATMTHAFSDDAHAGYPFALEIAIRYALDARGLSVEALVRNVGNAAAPCFFGWHPYFRLGDSPMESWELQVPATSLVATDTGFIPLHGAAARVPIDATPGLDFRVGEVIGPRQLNHAFDGLMPDPDGVIRSRLRDPATGLALALWQERGVMLAFTADTVSRDARRSLALEPMESWADAFNRPDCAAAIRLEPGAERSFRCGVEIHTL